eukprot:jgi/Tetstr1/434923/TSEL_023920.t1
MPSLTEGSMVDRVCSVASTAGKLLNLTVQQSSQSQADKTTFQVTGFSQDTGGAAEVKSIPGSAGRTLRTPGTFRRRWLWTQLIALVVMEFAKWGLVLSSPCWVSNLAADSHCSSYYAITGHLDNAKIFSTYGTMFGISVAHMYHVALARYSALLPAHKTHLRHWTLAASRGVFIETADTVMKAQTLAIAVTAVVVTVCLFPITAITVEHTLLQTDKGRADWEGGIGAACGPGITLCSVAWFSEGIVVWATAWMLMTLITVFVSTPAQLWSPVCKEAIAETRHTRLSRALWLPGIAILLGGGLLAELVVLQTRFRRSVATSELICTMWLLSVALFLITALALAWLGGLMAKRGADKGGAPLRTQLRSVSTPLDVQIPRGGVRGWVDAALRQLSELRIEPGVRYMQGTVLTLSLFLWCTNTISWMNTAAGIAVVWISRILLLALLMFGTGEKVASFDLLKNHGTGFGLVVGAKELAEALERAADGKPPLHRRLPLYKASALRLAETMAISYRWQADEVELAEGSKVNMTKWQMVTLARTIRSSTALYVWLDHISVPQDGHRDLQKTLLARMMAVYATAHITVALRSCEVEGSRYHQRGWTAQEYCTAPNIMVATESEESSAEVPFYAVEEDMMREVRAWWQQRAVHCKPFWLYGGVAHMPTPLLRASMDKYEEVSSQVLTQQPADLLRALYPLLFHVPVENQDELVELVQEVNDRLGRTEPILRHLITMPTAPGARQFRPPADDTVEVYVKPAEPDRIDSKLEHSVVVDIQTAESITAGLLLLPGQAGDP